MMEFHYPKFDDPMLTELREEAGLQVPRDSNAVQRALAIAGFTHTLFTHGGNNTPSSFDALTIMREAMQGESFRCVEYSILGAGLLWAYGIPARVAGLKTADVETREYGAGHVVVEFWDDAAATWNMCDVQWGVLPKLGEAMLSAYEFGEALKRNETVRYAPVNGSRFTTDKTGEYTDWIREYLYFYDTDLEVLHHGPYTDLAGERKLMLVPEAVKPPETFQGLFKMNLVYTTDPADLYPAILI